MEHSKGKSWVDLGGIATGEMGNIDAGEVLVKEGRGAALHD
jgi:hypothetical protein